MAKTIITIEDDNFLLDLEAKKLKEKGYEVLTAKNSIEAYNIFDKKVHIDLMLLDLMLPEVDGFTILEKIREYQEYKNTPVIVFSNLYEEKDKNRAMKMGVSNFMVKSNFTLDELTAKIKMLIG